MNTSIRGTTKWLACAAGLALMVLGGNSLAMADDTVPASTQTYTNVMTALRSEAFASLRYQDYAEIAQNAGYVSTSKQLTDSGQAKLTQQFAPGATLIGLVGLDQDNLKTAIAQAQQVSTVDYPAYASAASAAGDAAAATLFAKLAADVNTRLTTLQSALDVVTQAAGAPASMPAGPGAVQVSISQGPAQASDPTTLANLNTAMENEAFAYAAYMEWASAAGVQGDVPLCQLLMAIGDVDWYESFRQIANVAGLYADTGTNLKNAIAAETDTNTANTGYATTATGEGYTAAAQHFTTLATDNTNDATVLQKRLDTMGSGDSSSGSSADTSNSISSSPKPSPASTKPKPPAATGSSAQVAVLTAAHDPASITDVAPVPTQPSAVAGQLIAAKNNQINSLKAAVENQVPGSPQWVSGWASLNDLYHQLDTLQNPLAYSTPQSAEAVANQKLADIARETAALNTVVSSTSSTSQSHAAAVQQIQTLSSQSSLITQMQNQLSGKPASSTPAQASTTSPQNLLQALPPASGQSGQQGLASIQQGQSLVEQGLAMIQQGHSEIGQVLVQQGNAMVQQGESSLGSTQTQAAPQKVQQPSQPQQSQAPAQPKPSQPAQQPSASQPAQPKPSQSSQPAQPKSTQPAQQPSSAQSAQPTQSHSSQPTPTK